MRHIDRSSNFKRQYKLMMKRRKDEWEIREAISMLANDIPLPTKYRDHALSGNWRWFRDCHIEPDWLVLYRKGKSDDGQGILFLEATGTHSDLFD